jgi:hypothetical protein
MVNTPTRPNIQELHANAKMPAKETILTPRFYTTDYDEMAKMDLSVNEDELRALVEELALTTTKSTLSAMPNLTRLGITSMAKPVSSLWNF